MKTATLDLTPELFIEFAKACKTGPPRRFVVKKNPLPDDAEIVDIRLRDPYEPYTLRLFIRSESFADVPEGSDPPELEPVWFETQHDQSSSDWICTHCQTLNTPTPKQCRKCGYFGSEL